MSNFFIYLLLLLNLIFHCVSFEPGIMNFNVGMQLMTSYFLSSYNYFIGNKPESCEDPWIKFNLDGLKSDLQQHVFGQHLVNDYVHKLLEIHTKMNPTKAFVMSFHGCSGCGKTLVSKFIAKNMFIRGFDSEFVHIYAAGHFQDRRQLENYKERLTAYVEKAMQKCNHNLFIFEEVDAMPPGLLDVLIPYVGYCDSPRCTNYGKNVFIFLSTSGSTKINEATLRLRQNDKERKYVTLDELRPLIIQSALTSVGGLQHSRLFGLIDMYVPFLPLEKEQVKLCINEELKFHGKEVTAEITDMIASELDYAPAEFPIFSRFGCKKIYNMVQLYTSMYTGSLN